MGAARKLQSEIDRTLKKVQEGVDVFETIWQKVYDTENGNQKEKYEADLKKEIKKLQRYRDQIKTWVANSDIKDKSPLLDARKQIEREMERFKICEKETKTKAFSKEGLGQAAKLDPKEKAKMDARDWLNEVTETLNTQVDEFDFEIENLTSTMKKNKPPPLLAQFEESGRRHKEHIRRLEQMMRCLDNDSITPEEVTDMKDYLQDYLDRNQTEFDEFAEVDDTYYHLLEKLDGATALDAVPAVAVIPEKKDKDKKTEKERKADKEKEKEKEREAEKEAERKRERDRQAAATLKSQVRGTHTLPPKVPDRQAAAAAPAASKHDEASDDKKAVAARTPQSNAVAAPAPSPQGSPAPAVPTAMSGAPNMQRAASAPGVPSAARSESHAAPGVADMMGGNRAKFPGPAQPGASASGVHQLQQLQQQQQPPLQKPQAPVAPDAPSAGLGPQGARGQPSWMFSGADATDPSSFSQLGGESRRAEILPDQKSRYLSRYQQVAQQNAGNLGMMDPTSGQLKVGPSAAALQGMEGDDKKPAGMDGMLMGNGMASATGKEGMTGVPGGMGGMGISSMGYGSAASHNANHQLLVNCAHRSIPQPGDASWNSTALRPRTPQGVAVPSSYPTSKMQVLDNPALFEKLDSEALFFAFYHQPGTNQQYLAARELKRQSWRYHKIHGAWFQRHEEPTAITDEFEQGTYVYFDYNILHDDMQSGWCYRLKQDFTFEYDALEDELVV